MTELDYNTSIIIRYMIYDIFVYLFGGGVNEYN